MQIENDCIETKLKKFLSGRVCANREYENALRLR